MLHLERGGVWDNKSGVNMKLLLYISLIILFSISSYAHENGLNPVNEPDVKGGYRKCTVLKYNYVNGILDTNSKFVIQKKIYNVNGFITNKQDFHNSIILKEYIFHYDSENKLLEDTEIDSEQNMIVKSNYLYDTIGLLNEYIIILPDSIISKIVYKYNTQNCLVEKVHLDSEGSVESKYIYVYDSLGNKAEIFEYFDNDEKFESRYFYQYDNFGNELETARFSKYNKIMYKTQKKYNGKNKLLELKHISYSDSEQIIEITNYDYDNHNNLISETVLFNDSFDKQVKYQYDGYGNLIQKIEYNSKKQPNNRTDYIYEP